MAHKLSSKTSRDQDMMISRTNIISKLDPIENAPHVKNESAYSFHQQKIASSLNKNSDIKNTTVESFHS